MKKTLNINENNVTICIEKLDLEKFQRLSFESIASYDLEEIETMVLKELDSYIIKQRERAEEEILIFLYKIVHRNQTNEELCLPLGRVPFKFSYNGVGVKTQINMPDMEGCSEFFNMENQTNISSCLYCILKDLNEICLRYSGDDILYEIDEE